MTHAAPIIAAHNVSQYFDRFRALHDVSVSFERGKISAIIGPNGAGKSTLFNVLSGALKPGAGQLEFEGRDITRMPQHRFAHLGIAKSFQITSVFPQLPVLENVRLAAQALAVTFDVWSPRTRYRDLISKAEACLAAAGLLDRKDAQAGTLAHGEQRALEIAMALAGDPRLLLLDEPTAGMSPEETTQMMQLIRKLGETRTVILVEHKMRLVMGISDRVIVLHHGELIADGTPAEIRSDPLVKRVYLGEEKA